MDLFNWNAENSIKMTKKKNKKNPDKTGIHVLHPIRYLNPYLSGGRQVCSPLHHGNSKIIACFLAGLFILV